MNQTAEVDWEAGYTDLLPRIYNFFRYRVPDRATAEDLTAATLERAWSKRDRYQRDRASFSTWVFGIARNVALGYYRQHRSEIPLDTLDERASDSSVEESLEQQSDRERLFALLRRLSIREQEPVALKYGAELTNREIARVTGLSESNVGTILSRVIQKMRAEGIPIVLTQELFSGPVGPGPVGSGSVQEVKVNGEPAALIRGVWVDNSKTWSVHDQTLLWRRDGVDYRLSAPLDISTDDLVRMAESLR